MVRGTGYSCLGAEALAPVNGERESYGEVVLVRRLREAIQRLNPAIPEEVTKNVLSGELSAAEAAEVVHQPGRRTA